jgi:ring-1,2-phenylacetyl-CoA epoxidase subunit PaaE
MHRYHPLTVLDKRRETQDSLRISLDVPEHLQGEFAFAPGQHLPIRVTHEGKVMRRTYSICSPPGRWPLEIGIRVQQGGAFSTYADDVLAPGDTLEAMPPSGRFHASPDAAAAKFYVAFAAGSGITPILSIVTSLLEHEPNCRVALFYGNRRHASAMFVDDLFALKNRFPARLLLHFLFSQEVQEFDISAGRLDRDKVCELWSAFCRDRRPDEAFVCGPDTMIDTVREALVEQGIDAARIHAERFGVPRKAGPAAPLARAAESRATVTVILDGHRRSFEMDPADPNIVDAAAAQGIELPYSCKGGVCATCRCLLADGRVEMAVNYGLEPWEVEKGYILACQSVPRSAAVLLDYDTP